MLKKIEIEEHMTTTVTTTKVVASTSLSVALMSFFNDAETVMLIITGVFASTTSYFYDWVHRHPLVFGVKEFSELLKYTFYGLCVVFIIYNLGTMNGDKYVILPDIVWGFIAALCAGSAVKIVDFISTVLGNFITKKAQ